MPGLSWHGNRKIGGIQMACKYYKECSIAEHLKKVLELNEIKEEDKIKLGELLDNTCNKKGLVN